MQTVTLNKKTDKEKIITFFKNMSNEQNDILNI